MAETQKARRRGCVIESRDYGSKNQFFFMYMCKGKQVAGINAAKVKRAGKMRFVVRGVNVLPEYRRKGIATELYEVAAREACSRRVPLASDERTTEAHSIDFWHKQLRKGRAVVLSKRGGREAGKPAPVYSLTCPAPDSLARARHGR